MKVVTKFSLILEDIDDLEIAVEITDNNYIQGRWDSGRFLLRKSGTENLIRLLVEDENSEFCNTVFIQLKKLIYDFLEQKITIERTENE